MMNAEKGWSIDRWRVKQDNRIFIVVGISSPDIEAFYQHESLKALMNLHFYQTIALFSEIKGNPKNKHSYLGLNSMWKYKSNFKLFNITIFESKFILKLSKYNTKYDQRNSSFVTNMYCTIKEMDKLGHSLSARVNIKWIIIKIV